jgi:hypothetical protein
MDHSGADHPTAACDRSEGGRGRVSGRRQHFTEEHQVAFILHPTNVLKIGGTVLILLGLFGLTGVAGFQWFHLTAGENVAHIALGIVGLAVAFGTSDVRVHRGLVAVLAITGIGFGLLGFALPSGGALVNGAFQMPNLGVANLENPADNLLHIVVGIWTGASALWGRAQMAMAEARA